MFSSWCGGDVWKEGNWKRAEPDWEGWDLVSRLVLHATPDQDRVWGVIARDLKSIQSRLFTRQTWRLRPREVKGLAERLGCQRLVQRSFPSTMLFLPSPFCNSLKSCLWRVVLLLLSFHSSSVKIRLPQGNVYSLKDLFWVINMLNSYVSSLPNPKLGRNGPSHTKLCLVVSLGCWWARKRVWKRGEKPGSVQESWTHEGWSNKF